MYLWRISLTNYGVCVDYVCENLIKAFITDPCMSELFGSSSADLSVKQYRIIFCVKARMISLTLCPHKDMMVILDV